MAVLILELIKLTELHMLMVTAGQYALGVCAL